MTSAAKRVLLVEDEPGLVLTLTDRLRSEGYEVATASDGPAGLERATREQWDVILLDVMLPGASGFDVCRDLRQRGVTTPVIMLTARGQVVDKVLGLQARRRRLPDQAVRHARALGADRSADAAARDGQLAAAATQYTLRRHHRGFPQGRSHARNGQALDLSAREFLLLKYFIEHREATLTRDELLNEVWGYHSMPSTRTVDVHVAWLRQKIEPNSRHPQYVLTVHGLGYKFIG